MSFKKYKKRLALILIVPAFIMVFASVIFAKSDKPSPSDNSSRSDNPYHGDNWYHYEHGMELLRDKNYIYATQEFNYYLEHPEIHLRMRGVAWFGRGLVYLAKHNDDGAIFAFQQAIKNDIHPIVKISDKAYLNMGNIFHKKKAYADSNKYYLKAVESNPGSGLAHYFLGLSYFEIGEYEKASEEDDIAKKLGVTFTGLSDKLNGKKTSAPKPSP